MRTSRGGLLVLAWLVFPPGWASADEPVTRERVAEGLRRAAGRGAPREERAVGERHE